MFIAALLIAKGRNPNVHLWMNKCDTYTHLQTHCIPHNGILFSYYKEQSTDKYAATWMNLEHICYVKKPRHKKTYMIPFVGYIHNRQIQRARKQIRG